MTDKTIAQECPKCGAVHQKLDRLEECIWKLIRKDEQLFRKRSYGSSYLGWSTGKPPFEAISKPWLLTDASIEVVNAQVREFVVNPLAEGKIWCSGIEGSGLRQDDRSLLENSHFWDRHSKRYASYWVDGFSPVLPAGWQDMTWGDLRPLLLQQVAGEREKQEKHIADTLPLIAEAKRYNEELIERLRGEWAVLPVVDPAFELKFEAREHAWAWNTPAQSLPDFSVHNNAVTIRYGNEPYKQYSKWVVTELQFRWATDGHCVQVRGQVVGEIDYSIQQKFNFFVFKPGNGDGGIYVHRAPLSWWDMSPDGVITNLKRWKTAVQQGDVLFLPVKDGRVSREQFLHELASIGSGKGSHKFSMPVSGFGEYIATDSAVEVLHHEHPTVTLEPGIYRVGTTLPGLSLENKAGQNGESIFFVPRGETRETRVWGQWRD